MPDYPLKQESFTNTNNTTLASHDSGWLQRLGTYRIQSNACAAFDATGGFTLAVWQTNQPQADQYVQAVLPQVGGGVYLGILSRATITGNINGYYFFTNGSESYLGTVTNSSFADIGGDRGSFAANDIIRMEWNATNGWTLLKNGSSIASGTDSTYASGYAGIAGYSYTESGTRVDSWECGSLSGGVSGNPWHYYAQQFRSFKDKWRGLLHIPSLEEVKLYGGLGYA